MLEPKYGHSVGVMQKISIRLPARWQNALIVEFGAKQIGIEKLAQAEIKRLTGQFPRIVNNTNGHFRRNKFKEIKPDPNSKWGEVKQHMVIRLPEKWLLKLSGDTNQEKIETLVLEHYSRLDGWNPVYDGKSSEKEQANIRRLLAKSQDEQ